MAETFVEYTQRLRGYIGSKDPLQSMQETPSLLAGLLHSASESVLSQSPGPGKWSVQEIIAHLADSELVSGFRFRAMVGADDGVPIQGYDQDRWAEASNYARKDPQRSLELYRTMREGNLRLLKSLKPEQWKHYGIHSERGQESIETIARMYAAHDLNHLRQIQAIIETSPARR